MAGLPINAIKDVLLQSFLEKFLKLRSVREPPPVVSNNNDADDRLWRILNKRIYPWVRL